MNVDFSQFSQNVAVTGLSQDIARDNAKQLDKVPADKSVSAESISSQELTQSVDNSEQATQGVGNIEIAVSEVSEFVQARNRQLAFSIDEDSRRSVVKVTDSDSGEVIRQIPSEEVLALSERIKELQSDIGAAVGVLFNKQV